MFRRLFGWLWDAHERLLLRLWRVEDVGDPDTGLFRIRVIPYRGEDVTLADGTTVSDREEIGELHMRNDVLRRLHAMADTPRRVGHLGRRWLQQSLRGLAVVAADEASSYSRVPAFRGITLIGLTGRRFGFETRPMRPGLHATLMRWYQGMLTARTHPLGWRWARKSARRYEPLETWMSRGTLLELYGPESEHHGDRDEAEAGVTQPGDDGREGG